MLFFRDRANREAFGPLGVGPERVVRIGAQVTAAVGAGGRGRPIVTEGTDIVEGDTAACTTAGGGEKDIWRIL